LALSKKYPQIKGVMIESNIHFWNQKFDPCRDDKNKLEYGVSITDECISLEQTKELLEKINNFRSL
jgi:3-deoxy-7-phosphoheptulonate synthase